MAFDLVLNFDANSDKRRLYGVLRQLRGRHRVELSKFRPRRSDRQNAWYWGVVMPMAATALSESQGETFDADRAHLFFKGLYLSEPVINRKTGEVLSTIVRSSAVLSTGEFTEYVEKVRQWLAESLGVVVPDPSDLLPSNTKESSRHGI